MSFRISNCENYCKIVGKIKALDFGYKMLRMAIVEYSGLAHTYSLGCKISAKQST